MSEKPILTEGKLTWKKLSQAPGMTGKIGKVGLLMQEMLKITLISTAVVSSVTAIGVLTYDHYTRADNTEFVEKPIKVTPKNTFLPVPDASEQSALSRSVPYPPTISQDSSPQFSTPVPLSSEEREEKMALLAEIKNASIGIKELCAWAVEREGEKLLGEDSLNPDLKAQMEKIKATFRSVSASVYLPSECSNPYEVLTNSAHPIRIGATEKKH
ncbi:MAG: hypothetical protein WCJ84_05180 [Candidatus Peregrinibacteria bacterium]